jgi:lipopolysaccharide export system protein LptA
MNDLIRTILLSIGLCMGLCIHLDAFAEKADKDKPLEIEADKVTSNDATQISVYTGNVILTQGTMVIHADKLVVHEDDQGFQHGTSTGNPTTFKQKREGKNEYMQGSALRIEYDGRMDKVQLYTHAWVKRGEDIVNGDYISYDANAEYAEVLGGTKSVNGDASSGRVKAIIQPKNKAVVPKSEIPQTDAPSPTSDTPNATKTLSFTKKLELQSDQ